jgi:hypothetical protein
VQNTGCGVSGG